MRYFLALTLLAFTATTFGQKSKSTKAPAKNAEKNVTQEYKPGENMPGPSYNLLGYLNSSLKYPPEAMKKHIEGTVKVQFFVNEDGSISDAHVIEGVGGGCDEEALRVVKEMPAWRPGKADGKPIKTSLVQPISFTLPKPEKK